LDAEKGEREDKTRAKRIAKRNSNGKTKWEQSITRARRLLWLIMCPRDGTPKKKPEELGGKKRIQGRCKEIL